MAIYASFQARGTRGAELATLGAISAPLASLAQDQFFTARAAPGRSRPAKGKSQPIAVQSSTSVPSGQRT
ncbi:hypothetical protein ASC95_14965 [Pelomonas sp. Root1217]|uniref:hypothetical protein n=1 Tax=Pelomonas sp. Root1217 TaxID=1736430 RepID=UPI0007091063|nr:hypothetical protein [Pelomonas sp. Root1217]KQV50654.1 hypothetical protein ASC95_14965 [Pelomonas sp. Root1217]